MKTSNKNNELSKPVFFTITALIGLVVYIVTPYITTIAHVTTHDLTLSKLIMQTAEFAYYQGLFALFITGCIIGFIRPKEWLLIGVSLVIFLPINTLIGIIISPTSHNLWPFELLAYVTFFGTVTVAGAFLGSRIRTGKTVWDSPK